MFLISWHKYFIHRRRELMLRNGPLNRVTKSNHLTIMNHVLLSNITHLLLRSGSINSLNYTINITKMVGWRFLMLAALLFFKLWTMEWGWCARLWILCAMWNDGGFCCYVDGVPRSSIAWKEERRRDRDTYLVCYRWHDDRWCEESISFYWIGRPKIRWYVGCEKAPH